MASEQLNKVIERIKSQPQNPNASITQRRAGMERISERVAKDVECDAGQRGRSERRMDRAARRDRRSSHFVSARRRIHDGVDQFASRDDRENRARVECSGSRD